MLSEMSGQGEAPRFDLQSHSRHSDGALEPGEVVRLAARSGVELLALTDHDTVGGVEEAVAAGEAAEVEIVPAVELSALHQGYEDLHVLGYRIDHTSPGLLRRLEEFRADRRQRAERMAAALRESGLALDEQQLASQASGGSVGRPHLARAVFEDPGNEERLRSEGLETPSDVLEAYLLPGKPGYRGRTRPEVREAIELIRESGGVAVWAHPFWDIADEREVVARVERFAEWGLQGVESFYVTHDKRQVELLDDTCRRLGLLSTGSSDFHGPEHARFSRFAAFSLYGREPRLGAIAG